MSDHGVPAVGSFGSILQKMLERGKSSKDMGMVEPPMSKSDISDLLESCNTVFEQSNSIELKTRNQYPIIETAIRDKFNALVVRVKVVDVLEESLTAPRPQNPANRPSSFNFGTFLTLH